MRQMLYPIGDSLAIHQMETMKKYGRRVSCLELGNQILVSWSKVAIIPFEAGKSLIMLGSDVVGRLYGNGREWVVFDEKNLNVPLFRAPIEESAIDYACKRFTK